MTCARCHGEGRLDGDHGTVVCPSCSGSPFGRALGVVLVLAVVLLAWAACGGVEVAS